MHILWPTFRNLFSDKIRNSLNLQLGNRQHLTSGYWKTMSSLQSNAVAKSFCIRMLISLGRPGSKPCLHQSRDTGPQGREGRHFEEQQVSPQFFTIKVGLIREPHIHRRPRFIENPLAVCSTPERRRHLRAGLRFPVRPLCPQLKLKGTSPPGRLHNSLLPSLWHLGSLYRQLDYKFLHGRSWVLYFKKSLYNFKCSPCHTQEPGWARVE